ncbi:MAG: hypothetical protein ACRDJN_00535, partial [Chloroflexota bacterium]
AYCHENAWRQAVQFYADRRAAIEDSPAGDAGGWRRRLGDWLRRLGRRRAGYTAMEMRSW